ncbi:hypothetical protein EVAR_74202_1 [Eumeta japonica]|uniref:Uncharacterized protein n=1 Tax=Eumeta variegata TaxID=151549 RepID=A0A4C1SCE9_EUMVA|nr:hypothetical protein EVAR_74202_1 [Eumeta japonica]
MVKFEVKAGHRVPFELQEAETSNGRHGTTANRCTKRMWRSCVRLPNLFVYRNDEVSPRGIAFRSTAVLVRRDIIHGGLEQPDFTDTRADVLDVVLCHQLSYSIHVEVLYDMDTQQLLLLITLGTTTHMTPARPPTHRTAWSAFKSALEELHIGKSFSCPEVVDLAAQRLTEKVQAAYSAVTTRLPAQTSRRWDLTPHIKLALQKKRKQKYCYAICTRQARILPTFGTSGAYPRDPYNKLDPPVAHLFRSIFRCRCLKPPWTDFGFRYEMVLWFLHRSGMGIAASHPEVCSKRWSPGQNPESVPLSTSSTQFLSSGRALPYGHQSSRSVICTDVKKDQLYVFSTGSPRHSWHSVERGGRRCSCQKFMLVYSKISSHLCRQSQWNPLKYLAQDREQVSCRTLDHIIEGPSHPCSGGAPLNVADS